MSSPISNGGSAAGRMTRRNNLADAVDDDYDDIPGGNTSGDHHNRLRYSISLSAMGAGGSTSRSALNNGDMSPTATFRRPVASNAPKQKDHAARVLQRVSGHLHKLNQGMGVEDNDDGASAAAGDGRAKPTGSSSTFRRSRRRRKPVLVDSRSMSFGVSLKRLSMSNKSVPCAPPTRPSSSASSISTFSALPHHETRIASNRGMYIRHRRLGAGSFGETWLCEWRPTDSSTRRNVMSANNSRKASSAGNSKRDANPDSLGSGSTNSSRHAPRTPRDDPDEEAPPPKSPAQQKAAVTPPAVVSALSCCSNTVVLRSKTSGDNAHSFSLPFDRVFVLKIDAKQPKEIAESRKAKVVHTEAETSGFSSAAFVMQHPLAPSRQVVAFTPPPLKALDKKQQLEEDAESLSVAEQYLQKSASASGLGGAGDSSNSSVRSTNDMSGSHSASHMPGTPGPPGPSSLGNNSSGGSQRFGGVPVMGRKSTQHALRNHTSTMSREGSVLRDCAHPNIVGFVDEFEDETNRYLVMEYIDGGDLREEVQRRAQLEQQSEANRTHSNHLSVPSALFLWVQALCAVEYLHRHNILHHDIKTANLLCSKKWRVLLADFGFARNYGHDIDERCATITAQGTPHYMAPELFRREPVSGKADIWALGVVLFELLALKRPFEQRNNSADAVASRVVNQQHAQVNSFRPPHLQVPSDVIALIDAMLHKDPAKRPTAKQLMRMPLVGAALTDYQVSFKKAADQSTQSVDKMLIAMLEEHIKLVREDDLSSPASRRRQAEVRRAKVQAGGGRPEAAAADAADAGAAAAAAARATTSAAPATVGAPPAQLRVKSPNRDATEPGSE